MNPAYDSDEVKEAATDPGADLLNPHGLQWVVAEGGVRVEEPDVPKYDAKLMWHDGLGHNQRSPFYYFYHLYPREHLKATLAALNWNMEHLAGVHRKVTEQEWFVFIGLLFLISFYPKFDMNDLFSPSANVRSTPLLPIPDLSKYMAFNRFKSIIKHMAHVECNVRPANSGAFWKVTLYPNPTTYHHPNTHYHYYTHRSNHYWMRSAPTGSATLLPGRYCVVTSRYVRGQGGTNGTRKTDVHT